MKDRSTGKSRGFGFVTFQRSSDAAHAGNKEHMVDGRRCEVIAFLQTQSALSRTVLFAVSEAVAGLCQLGHTIA